MVWPAPKVPVCTHTNEVFLGYSEGKFGIHDTVKLRLDEGTLVATAPGEWEPAAMIETTVGRVLFNDILPFGMPFYNYTLDKKIIRHAPIEDGALRFSRATGAAAAADTAEHRSAA